MFAWSISVIALTFVPHLQRQIETLVIIGSGPHLKKGAPTLDAVPRGGADASSISDNIGCRDLAHKRRHTDSSVDFWPTLLKRNLARSGGRADDSHGLRVWPTTRAWIRINGSPRDPMAAVPR